MKTKAWNRLEDRTQEISDIESIGLSKQCNKVLFHRKKRVKQYKVELARECPFHLKTTLKVEESKHNNVSVRD